MKSLIFNIKIFIFLFILFHSVPLFGQTLKGEIALNKIISAGIRSGEKHQYTIRLEENKFATFKVEQKNIDLLISTYDISGNKIKDFDSPNGSNGIEFVSINSDKKGIYRLEIYPLNPESKGEYTLRINKIVPDAKTTEDKVDQLFAAWDSQETPGATVSVVKDGKIIYKKGYGMANLEYDIPNRPDTIFHIASVSKQFTTFAILLLEKDGKLSLDDDIRKHIPEVPDFGKKITLRHLAHHTSGLRDQWALIAMAGGRLDDVITKEHILKLVERQKELNFEPGAEYLYSNTGFTLLAEVVARVSGKSFPDFTRERIFEPLKMKNTLFYDDHQKIVKNRAYSYFPVGNNYIKLVLSYANVGATSLFTTVEDLSLWSLNFENPVVGDRPLMDKMKTPGVLNNDENINYALGQVVDKYKGLNRISHGGGDAGYRTYLARFPDEKFSVIVFSNDGSFNGGGMAHQVIDIYLEDKFAKPQAKPAPTTPSGPETKAINIDSRLLKSYVGTYQLQPTFLISITESEGKLFGQATGQPKLELIALGENKFKVKDVAAEISFHQDNENKINVLKLDQGGRVQDAKKIQPFDPKTVVLSDFTGEFYSEELATTYKLMVKDGKLSAIHSRLPDIEISPVSEDSFSANLWFFRQIQFVRNPKKEITGIRVSNGRVRNLWFKKIK